MATYDGNSIFVFVVSRNVKGEQVLVHISTVPIPFANTPLMLSKGIVYCHTQVTYSKSSRYMFDVTEWTREHHSSEVP